MADVTLATNAFSHQWEIINNDDFTESLAGAMQFAGRTGNRYSVKLTFRRGLAELDALIGQLAGVQGHRNRLIVPLSTLGYVPGGAGGGTPQLDGAHSAGATSISIKGMPFSTTVRKAGNFIQVGNQLTQLAEDLISNGSGLDTVNIWPELHQAYSNNQSLDYDTTASLYAWASDNNFGSGPWPGGWFGPVTVDLMQDVLA